MKTELLLAAALLSGTTQAALVEQQAELPVQVSDAYGKAITQNIRVTLFFDDTTAAPRPVLLLNHGRAPDAEGRAALGRARFVAASRWFAARGFLVALPTRIGYGESGGEDIEDSGACEHKHFVPGFAAAAQQGLTLLAWLRARPDARSDRTVLLGQSYGGATTVALAAQNPPGVVAAINFAGGSGGNPKTQPGRPCAPQRLERVYADYGRSARVPSLWVYTENDLYFGARYPRDWAQAYREAGAPVEFVQLPPHGDDGHQLFARFPQVWQPVVADFLRRQGFDIKD
ncbi:MAG: dienelactone hydrolase [Roseateles depolymerans]|uniref:Dienelactone hydrolase n=1 Tax=Roseateles depolymerans TaxID=76731 RepID=A0A2W5DQ20_9BURK|nr:MAG: dienelactone hydrolase [Roseateles depolymerans]